MFISIHHNAAANPEAQGTEVLNDSERTTQKDRRLARIIQEKIVKIMWQGKDKEGDVKVDRGNKNMGLTVLRNVPAGVEACCLSEAYFVSGNTVTPAKARHWSTLEAEALVEGIADYWKSRNSPSLALAGEAPFPPSENPEQYVGH